MVWQGAVVAGVRVSGSSGCEEHFNGDDHKDRSHGYEACHCRISFVPECWKAWIGHGDECGREEMDESGCDEDPCAEMA